MNPKPSPRSESCFEELNLNLTLTHPLPTVTHSKLTVQEVTYLFYIFKFVNLNILV